MLMKASIKLKNLDIPMRVTKLKIFKVCTTGLINNRRSEKPEKNN